MSKEKKTEEIIKDKLDSRGFSFDEKAWAGMETLLDAQAKKRKRAAFWIFSASMLAVLMAGAALLWKLEVGSEKMEVSQTTVIESNTQKPNSVTPSVVDNNALLY